MQSLQSGKLKVLESILADIKPLIERAAHDFKRDCLENELNPHSSRVHIFQDTLAQAYVLAIPGRTEQEIYNLAYLTFCSHAFDDAVENAEDLDKYLPFKAQAIKEMTLKVSSKAANSLIESMVHGALIQQAKTRREQEVRTLKYREHILSRVSNAPLKRDLEQLHPVLLAQSTHAEMAAFFGLESDTPNFYDLGAIASVYFAPALYYHDVAEEKEHENSKMLFGRELCKRNWVGLSSGQIKDSEMVKLIDLFDRNIAVIPDVRAELHYKQRRLVYEATKTNLPTLISERYAQSLDKCS